MKIRKQTIPSFASQERKGLAKIVYQSHLNYNEYDVLCQEQKQHYPAAGDHLLIEEITDQEVMEEELTPQGTQDYQIKTQSSTCDKAKLPMSVRKLNTF